MIYEMTANLFCAFIGTVGYSVLYNVPKRYYLSCGFTGTMGWLAFLLVKNGTPLSSAVASFFAALVVVLMSRLLTVRMKCPITIFLVSGIFPLVPGARVYYTVYYLVTSEMGKAAQEGLEALKIAFGIVDMRRDNPFHLVLAISAVSVAFMCPCMSFAATVLIKHAPASQIIPTWLQTTAMNFPMAFFWQIFYAGPFVRFIFGKLFPEKEKAAASAE